MFNKEPTIKRPSFPNQAECANIAAGLHLLANMMHRDPDAYRVQHDQGAVMSQTIVKQMAQDFQNAPRNRQNAERSFFYAEEKATFVAALQYLATFQMEVGRSETSHYLSSLMDGQPVNIMDPKTLINFSDDIARGIDLNQLDANSLLKDKAYENPHKGVTIDKNEAEWLYNASSPSPS